MPIIPYSYSLPASARRNTPRLTGLPVSRFCVRKIPAAPRKMNTTVTTSRRTASPICQSGTAVAARRAIIATGEVSGKRLRITASCPLGLVPAH